MGSAWKFVALAKGEIDLFPRFGPSHEWDTAAGQIIIEEAGASLLALDTLQPLAYGKPDWFNSAGFVAGAPELLTDERLKSLVDLRGETEGKA
jgi:3'(2'), 5'-bisphosphate nucleotidase